MSLPPVCGGGDAEGRGETPHARYRVRGWGPPPQSLRDSSPSGGAVGSGCSWGNLRLTHVGSWIGALPLAVTGGACFPTVLRAGQLDGAAGGGGLA